MTTRLYQKDVYTKNWDTEIVSLDHDDKNPELAKVVLKESAFFPEGGGQSCDLGTIGGYPVIDVQEDNGEVYHTVDTSRLHEENAAGNLDAGSGGAGGDGSGGADGGNLEPGASVHCSLDWPRRFDNMQRHCGEHILSGIFYARCGGVNRGFHMGDDYMTIDISLEDDPSDADAQRPDSIDMDIALDVERRANEVIWSDAPVTVFRFDERDQVADMPLRKALAFDEDISIVCVGSPENAADCVACCGTHPSTSGQVGLIKIYKVENYKGMFRIYFEAGARALRDYERKHEIITTLAESHSSSVDDLPGAIHAQEEKLASAKNDLFHAKKALIRRESEALDRILSGSDQTHEDAPSADQSGCQSPVTDEAGGPLLLYRLEDFSLDDAFELSKTYMGKTPLLLLLYAVNHTSFILVSSGEPHCGNLVREYASFYNGKGGGNDTSARAIFTTDEDAMLFADLLEKHLK